MPTKTGKDEEKSGSKKRKKDLSDVHAIHANLMKDYIKNCHSTTKTETCECGNKCHFLQSNEPNYCLECITLVYYGRLFSHMQIREGFELAYPYCHGSLYFPVDLVELVVEFTV